MTFKFDQRINRYRVNCLQNGKTGKEVWKYCRTIKKARELQLEAIEHGLPSIICIKRPRDKKYSAL